MPSIKIDIEIEDQFLYDVMTTMVESGLSAVHYWSVVQETHRLADLSVYKIDLIEQDEGDDVLTIDSDAVINGIQMILDGTLAVNDTITGYISRAVREGDAGDIDATAADCIAQAAVLESIVYG